MVRLILRRVVGEGEPGEEIGALERDGDSPVVESGAAVGLMDSIARTPSGRRTADQVWDSLLSGGWSNGYVMITRE